MTTLFTKELDEKSLATLRLSVACQPSMGWASRRDHLVSIVATGHPRAAPSDQVHVLLMLDRTIGCYIELDAWRLYRPERRAGQSQDAFGREADHAFIEQLQENVERWTKGFRGHMGWLDEISGSPKDVLERAGHFILPLFDEYHIHPWPAAQWTERHIAMAPCASRLLVDEPDLDRARLTSQPILVGDVEITLSFDERQCSWEDIMQVSVGLHRGWACAQERGWIAAPVSQPVAVLVVRQGDTLVRHDCLQVSMERLRQLTGPGPNRSYEAMTVVAALHFKLATKADGDLLELTHSGYGSSFIAKVLASIDEVEHGPSPVAEVA